MNLDAKLKTFSPLICRGKHLDKMDIYDFGVILLELITGRHINSKNEEDAVKDQVRNKRMIKFTLQIILFKEGNEAN